MRGVKKVGSREKGEGGTERRQEGEGEGEEGAGGGGRSPSVFPLCLNASLGLGQVFAEMRRVLKPGGTAMMSFSNRCFPTKGNRLSPRSPLPPSSHFSLAHCCVVCFLSPLPAPQPSPPPIPHPLPSLIPPPFAMSLFAAISIWTNSGDMDHIWIVGSYFHYTQGFTAPRCKDISPKPGLFGPSGDPMYVVFASKTEEAPDM